MMRIAEVVITAVVTAGLSGAALAQSSSSAQPVAPNAGPTTSSQSGAHRFASACQGSNFSGDRSSYCGYGSGDGYYFDYGYPAAPYPFDSFDDSGKLRLHIEPKNAQVYVDGYYAGVVDYFDGHFQHLSLMPSRHHVEIVAPGYQPFTFDVLIKRHHKTTYRGVLLPSITDLGYGSPSSAQPVTPDAGLPTLPEPGDH
jgi:hypothetical protein